MLKRTIHKTKFHFARRKRHELTENSLWYAWILYDHGLQRHMFVPWFIFVETWNLEELFEISQNISVTHNSSIV